MPYPDLIDLRCFLYEMGSIINDVISYKKLLAMASASFNNDKQFKKFADAYRESILPELGGTEDEIQQMSNLMKELENTIVVIDKKSFNQ